MKIQKTLRDMQDRLRNAGWRIQWIPWYEPDKPECICFKNPTALIGVAIFLGGVFFSGRLPVSGTFALATAGLGIAMLGILCAAIGRQIGWERADAVCIDREIRECRDSDGTFSWEYRLVCVFRHKGNEYRVTPEPSLLISFNSEQQVQNYLRERIQTDGRCHIWVNPQNPLQTVFHKKRWWI